MRIPIKDRLKYLAVFSIPVAVYFSFTNEGWMAFIPILYAFGVVPFLEFALPPQRENDSEELQTAKANDKWFDFLLILVVPIHYAFGVWFLFTVSQDADWLTRLGWIMSYGLMCGVLGINVAHELGHHTQKSHQLLAQALLLTSQYTHFFIEHNRGHHKNVATPEDPSTARFGEPLMFFWVRSTTQTYRKAWALENQRLRRKKIGIFSLNNLMIRFTLLQILVMGTVAFFFGLPVLLYYLAAAVIGFLLLETVNYIEHYGLTREKVSEFRYEDASPEHSWNSDHQMGRSLLFELSRHSDHHFQPAKRYQILQRWENSPQMPTGYPGMMLLSLIPPLWFAVMNKRVAVYKLSKVESNPDS